MTKKYILKIACIYTGTILGAGFATGKELLSFFGIFGKFGILGFFIACFLLSLCGVSILGIIHRTNAKTYKEFMYIIFGKLGKYIESFNTIFLFILFSAMLSGGGATISDTFFISEGVGIIVFCGLVFLALIFGERAIININTILCPILIIGGMLVGIYLYFFDTIFVFKGYGKALISPFIYTSYNVITTISVLFSVKDIIINRKVVIFGGILGGIFIFFIGVFMLLPLIENFNIIKDESLPILALVKDEKIIKNIYSFIVILAIFTTAISNGFALEDTFKDKFFSSPQYLKLAIIVLGVVLSFMGFSNIVDFVYPIFGYLGMFEIVVIVITFFSNSY